MSNLTEAAATAGFDSDGSARRDAAPDHRSGPPNWGKSATLGWLQGRLHCATIPQFEVLSRAAWQQYGEGLLGPLRHRLGARRYAVRSDCADEDQPAASQAGHYTTRLAVEPAQLGAAIDHVLAHMPTAPTSQVLIQRMVEPLRSAGVASTHRVHDGAPWYCIEIAKADPRAVTAGYANGRMLALCRQSVQSGRYSATRLNAQTRALFDCVREIEALLGCQPFEIEFAISGDNEDRPQLHLLQLRPLASTLHWPAAPALPALSLGHLRQTDPLPEVVGSTTLLSLMSDWNPAELIGSHPRPLARSLFDALIAQGTWWRARAELGYQPAASARINLLQTVAGRPYVDVRRSANSLLPAGLAVGSRQRLVDAWISQLAVEPALHDKVEFCIYRSATDFSAIDQLRARWDTVLGAGQLRDWQDRLAALTTAMMRPAVLTGLQQRLLDLGMVQAAPPALTARLASCRSAAFGFAQLARLAFVGEVQLRSALQRGALSAERCDALRRAKGSVRRLWLADEHGAQTTAHLRPGSFDITQARQPVAVFDCAQEEVAAEQPFVLDASERRALQRLLCEAALPADADAWLSFVAASCRGREWGKFILARHLNSLLEAIAAHCLSLGLTREHASWLDLDQLHRRSSESRQALMRRLRGCAERAQRVHSDESQRMLGPLLQSSDDAWLADSLGSAPNFIGRARADGPLTVLTQQSPAATELSGRIVAIAHADPGYDWLFSCGIRGLITAWGGAHSHMAIRCAEFALPAAIGCGEAVFAQVRRARHACIDPPAGALWLH